MTRIGVTSRGLLRMKHLQTFLRADIHLASRLFAGRYDMVAGWGSRHSGERARDIAAKTGMSCILLEDGFLRSVERNDAPLSIVVDDLGIYYDATRPSRLERLIAARLSVEEEARTRALISSWRSAPVSKYNHARDYDNALPGRYVLVADQTVGDASIRRGLADETTFQRMLDAALAENPDHTVVVKCHPDIYTRRKRGHFDAHTLARDARIQVIASDCHPAQLIERADAVYVVTSQIGFEALLFGKRTRVFGMPFYAGWGLTRDELSAPNRRGTATLDQLVHATLVAYPRYLDPETNELCEVERVLAHIALQRQMRSRFPSKLNACGFSWLKRPILRRFLKGSQITFHKDGSGRSSPTVVWGSAQPKNLPHDSRLIRVEDGFLRSVGLGADLVRPMSWVFDDEGIYYDSSRPSRLERILQETTFDTALLERARKLRERIVNANLTKYNATTQGWRRPATTKRVILVPGQVEHDAAIRFATPGVNTNIGLLRAVRQNNPDAYVVYKPHPDVAAGLRHEGQGETEVKNWCDEIVTDADMGSMLAAVDEVHVLTSLTGFEALLREKPVTCYGQPFYAGWGLTTEHAPLTRRTRALELDELVAGALILYPTYVSRVTECFTTPERVVDELIEWRSGLWVAPSFGRRLIRSALLFHDSQRVRAQRADRSIGMRAGCVEPRT